MKHLSLFEVKEIDLKICNVPQSPVRFRQDRDLLPIAGAVAITAERR
jgi:hypothetical protein